MTSPPVESFPALDALEDVLHGFTLRVPHLDVRTDRETALRRLDGFHEIVLRRFGPRQLRLAEQIHNYSVAVVSVVFLVEPKRRVIGLVHSGKKGTTLNIAGAAVQKMSTEFGSDPASIL